jgi:hypothetical protein
MRTPRGPHGDTMGTPWDLMGTPWSHAIYRIASNFTAMANARSGENPQGALIITENIAEYS